MKEGWTNDPFFAHRCYCGGDWRFSIGMGIVVGGFFTLMIGSLLWMGGII